MRCTMILKTEAITINILVDYGDVNDLREISKPK